MVRLFLAAALGCLVSACELSVYSDAGMPAAPPPPPRVTPAPAPVEPVTAWSIEGKAAGAYVAEADGSIERHGHATVRFHPTDDPGGAYATYMTTLDAAPFRGRRAHATVWVRTQGVSGRGDVWLRVRGTGSSSDEIALASSSTHLPMNAAFSSYELLLDVPAEATSVQLGVGLGGPGMLWMDAVTLEAL